MELHKCITCESSNIEIKPSEILMNGYYAECIDCEATGCSCITKEAAAKDWNELQDSIYLRDRY